MHQQEFVDYYEVLEVSTNANTDTIERVFRYLARKYHPDTAENQDRQRFSELVKAYETLRDPETRAAYDVQYEKHKTGQAGLSRDAEFTGHDTHDRTRMLSLFYAKRRRDMKKPGVGVMTLTQVLGCPEEVLNFHLWYFREKGWVAREQSGLLAITAEGVDEIEKRNQTLANGTRLITHSASHEPKPALAPTHARL